MKAQNSMFVVATPARSVCDENARVLAGVHALRFLALGTRRGTRGVPVELTRLKPSIGGVGYAVQRLSNPQIAESFRFRLFPWFDRWVRSQIVPGDHIIASYGHANESFRYVRQHGGKTFLDAGNSHPENFWEILTEEHRRWNWHGPPIASHQQRRALAMMPLVDYVLSPSTFVTSSFLERGFAKEQIVRNVYPVDLSCFKPATEPRPRNRPLTVISTGQLSLRKGTPYLLEAFRIIRRSHPSARLMLTKSIHESARAILAKYRDLPIEWAPGLPHPQLAARLQSADVFVLPSIEDGFARTVTEAMACGLPVVVTTNTGAADQVTQRVTGEVVPIRHPAAIADAVLVCFERLLKEGPPMADDLAVRLSMDSFAKDFVRQLRERNFLDKER